MPGERLRAIAVEVKGRHSFLLRGEFVCWCFSWLQSEVWLQLMVCGTKLSIHIDKSRTAADRQTMGPMPWSPREGGDSPRSRASIERRAGKGLTCSWKTNESQASSKFATCTETQVEQAKRLSPSSERRRV